MSAHTEALARFFAAINRHDLSAAAEHFAPDVVRVEPDGYPTSGTYRGIADVQAQLAKGRGTWAEGTCEPESFVENGDRVVANLYVRVRLNTTGQWVEGRFADGFVFRDGKIAEYVTFWQRADALAWAGIGG